MKIGFLPFHNKETDIAAINVNDSYFKAFPNKITVLTPKKLCVLQCDWQTVQGVVHLSPNVSCDRLDFHVTLNRIKNIKKMTA